MESNDRTSGSGEEDNRNAMARDKRFRVPFWTGRCASSTVTGTDPMPGFWPKGFARASLGSDDFFVSFSLSVVRNGVRTV